jgi:hypothetical protein
VERRIFRSIRAAIVYERSTLNPAELFSAENLYSRINVQLISCEKLATLLGDDYDVVGILGQPALDASKPYLQDFGCLKIGFYLGNEFTSEAPRSSLRYLTAAVACLGSDSLTGLLKTTSFHFYESLTLPSLLNIDLADVNSIAHGIGLSFNITGDSSEKVITRLPQQCYLARSALLHFTCKKDVTLDEVYKISKTISTRKTADPFISENPNDNIKMYKRIRLKMGLRISTGGEHSLNNISRISLTGILFGIKQPQNLMFLQ